MNLLHLLMEIEAEEARRQALIAHAAAEVARLKATLPISIERIVRPALEKLERRGRRRGPSDPRLLAQVRRLSRRGWSTARIANHLGMDRRTVKRYREWTCDDST